MVELTSKLDYQSLVSVPELVRVFECEPWTFQIVTPARYAEKLDSACDNLPAQVFAEAQKLPNPDILARICLIPRRESNTETVEVREKDIFIYLNDDRSDLELRTLFGAWCQVLLSISPVERFFHSLACLIDANEALLSGAVKPPLPSELWANSFETAYFSLLRDDDVYRCSLKVVARSLHDLMLRLEPPVSSSVHQHALTRLQLMLNEWEPAVDSRLTNIVQLKEFSQETQVAATKLILFYNDTTTLELPSVRELDISFEPWSNRDLKKLSCLTKLQTLNLAGTFINSDGLASMRWLPYLRQLNLRKTLVHDHGLQHLTGCRLVELDLSQTRITDAGLAFLSTMKDLKKIYLVETNITPEGIGKLRQDLPDCQIIPDYQAVS